MGLRDQIHIRDAETVELVRELARQTGRSMACVVREAVRAYAPPAAPRTEDRGEVLARALAHDRASLTDVKASGQTFELDDLYAEDGLPR